MELIIQRDKAAAAQLVARIVANELRAHPRAVLGLATGSTMEAVYAQLVRMHRENGLDFSGVRTFNLDEYWPMPKDSIHSYHRFMRETFFDHVNIPEESIHIPRGDVSADEVEEFCEEYERDIERVGGIDLMLLGLGRNGHIGFNEPGSDKTTRTRLVTLDPVTRQDAAGDFFGELVIRTGWLRPGAAEHGDRRAHVGEPLGRLDEFCHNREHAPGLACRPSALSNLGS